MRAVTPPKNPQPPPDSLMRAVLTDEQEKALFRTMGARVREARKGLGVTQAQLAKAFEQGQTWVAQIEAGKAAPQPYLIAALAAATGRSAGWFYGEPER